MKKIAERLRRGFSEWHRRHMETRLRKAQMQALSGRIRRRKTRTPCELQNPKSFGIGGVSSHYLGSIPDEKK